MRSIEQYAFAYSYRLKKINLPRGLETVGFGAFAGNGFEEVVLPRTIREIKADVFKDCSHLRTIWVERGCAADVSGLAGECVQVRQK